jgi:hypothetical protein
VGEEPGHQGEISRTCRVSPTWIPSPTKATTCLRGAHISEIDIWTYPDWIFPIVNRYMFPLEGRYWARVRRPARLLPTTLRLRRQTCAGQPGRQKLQALYEKGMATKTMDERHKVVWEAIQVIIDEGPFVIGVSPATSACLSLSRTTCEHPGLRRGRPVGALRRRETRCRRSGGWTSKPGLTWS